MTKSIRHRLGRRFAERIIQLLRQWSDAKTKPPIEARMYVGDQLMVFKFTVGQPCAFVRGDDGEVTDFVKRATEIAPTCDPAKGDLVVFDGRKILMFRRFDESLSMRSARLAANEIACHILMWRKHDKKTEGIGATA